ncbi:MAG: hypothetical protein JSV99_02965 [Planctomycetota bacterium]|nr:MAG: hypothetical protein JSV99_02965 [Planctomycetota bacterium]
MKTQKYCHIWGVVVVVLVLTALARPQPTIPHEEHTLLGNANPFLTGIGKLYAVILPLDAESNNQSALWQQLQVKLEQKLNKAGIKIISVPVFDSGLRAYDIPELRVYIDMLKSAQHQQYVFRIQTSLARAVCLTEKDSLLFKADVWRVAPAMQAVSDESMPATVAGVVLEQLEEFIHAYLVANQQPAQPADEPKRKAPVPPVTRREATRSPLRSSAAEYKYVASKNSKVFHNSECQWAEKIRPENLVGYNSRDQATRAGRRPCKTCNP